MREGHLIRWRQKERGWGDDAAESTAIDKSCRGDDLSVT